MAAAAAAAAAGAEPILRAKRGIERARIDSVSPCSTYTYERTAQEKRERYFDSSSLKICFSYG
jgi:hypothetical protein